MSSWLAACPVIIIDRRRDRNSCRRALNVDPIQRAAFYRKSGRPAKGLRK
jgi:hypothetical protein